MRWCWWGCSEVRCHFFLITHWPRAAARLPSADCRSRCRPWRLIGQKSINKVSEAAVSHFVPTEFILSNITLCGATVLLVILWSLCWSPGSGAFSQSQHVSTGMLENKQDDGRPPLMERRAEDEKAATFISSGFLVVRCVLPVLCLSARSSAFLSSRTPSVRPRDWSASTRPSTGPPPSCTETQTDRVIRYVTGKVHLLTPIFKMPGLLCRMLPCSAAAGVGRAPDCPGTGESASSSPASRPASSRERLLRSAPPPAGIECPRPVPSPPPLQHQQTSGWFSVRKESSPREDQTRNVLIKRTFAAAPIRLFAAVATRLRPASGV